MGTFIGMFALAMYALIEGEPDKFIAPYDADGHMCGFTDGFTANPKLYFTVFGIGEDISKVTRSGVCVTACPDATQIADASWWERNCLANANAACPKALVPGNPTPDYPYNSQAFLTYCIPSFDGATADQQTYYEKLKDDFLGKEAGQTLVGITHTWKSLLAVVGTGVIVSIMFMWFMSNCSGCLAMFIIVALLISFFGGGAACIFFGMDGKIGADGTKTTNQAMIICGCVLLFFGLCTLCMIYCNRASFWTAMAIIDASADFQMATKRLVFVSIFYFLVSLIIFFMWVFASACVFSMTEFEDPVTKGDQRKTLKEPSGKLWAMFAFMAFGLLWTFRFISDKHKYIAMVAAATYYFDSTATKSGSASVCTGYKFATFNNAGSIALGSLILTIVGILRWLVEQVAESANRDGDGAAKLVACLAKCLVSCLEAIIEHLSKLSYAYMSVAGESFCSSAWNGFILHLKHLAKFIFALKIAGLFVFMGIVTITCVNTGIGYCFAMYLIKDGKELSNILPSLITFAVVSFIEAIMFLGHFHEAVLATLVCFGIDVDLHDGEPKFGPKDYHEKLAHVYANHKQHLVQDELTQPLAAN